MFKVQKQLQNIIAKNDLKRLTVILFISKYQVHSLLTLCKDLTQKEDIFLKRRQFQIVLEENQKKLFRNSRGSQL